MKNKTGQILLHVTGCIAFLSLPVLLSPDVSWNFHFVQLVPFREDFISYTLLLLFFYLHYFWLVPKLYFRQKFIYYAACILLSYAAIVIVPHLIMPGNHLPQFQPMARRGPPPPSPPRDAGIHTGVQAAPRNSQPNGIQPPPEKGGPPGMQSSPGRNERLNMPPPQRPDLLRIGEPVPYRPGFFFMMPHFEYFFQFMMVLVLSLMIRMNDRLKQSEKEKVNAELSYLKAQINPHFLFNTLNSIYSLALDELADNTAAAIVKLSGMMRYVISEVHHNYVPLEKEFNYITSYIELQKIRLETTVLVKYEVSGTAAGKQIAPLILISFIENAFKHGVNPEANSNIEISIAVHNNFLHMCVRNNKVRTGNIKNQENNVGLVNTTNRLQLLYPSAHELKIKDNEKEFIVTLKMNLQ